MNNLWINFLSGVRALFSGRKDETAVRVEGGSYAVMAVPTLQNMLSKRPESFLLVNTHIPFDGDIPGTDFSIPYNRIQENLDQFPKDKHAEIVLYCMKDVTSRIAAKALVRAGYDDVTILLGGFVAWQDAGLLLSMEEPTGK